MRKRIRFKDIKITHLPINLENPEPPSSSDPISDLDLNLSLDGAYAPGYEPSVSAIVTDPSGKLHTTINGWPERTISIAIPAEDMSRVKAWFSGDYTGVTNAPSTNLQKNITTAISNLLSDYISTCQNHNLFTSPCRFAWCGIDKEGTRSKLKEIHPAQPNPEAPLLPIITHYFNDTHLTARVQIRNIPCKASLILNADDIEGLKSSQFESIEIYATKQVEFRAVKSEIYGINTVTIDGTPKRCWKYDYYFADEIENSVAQDSTFRCLCKIPLEYLANNNNSLILPISSGLLANFNSATIYKESSIDSSDKNDTMESLSNNEATAKWVHFITEPLNLGYPEEDKHLHSVTLFGIFERRAPEKIDFTLQGSHHREYWHTVAATHGHIIHGLRRVPFRWWRVQLKLELRPADTIEALTFEF